MLRDVAATVETLVREEGNTLALTLGAGLGAMRSDVTKIRQTLLNLLSNAAKFTEGGTITLAARARRDGAAWCFSVRDSGIGMTRGAAGQAVPAFPQADASTTRRFGGTGLGLSITKAFMTMLGGHVDVQSEPGQGSTFTVRLPADFPEPQQDVLAQVAREG